MPTTETKTDSKVLWFSCKRCGHRVRARRETGIKISEGRVVLVCDLCGCSNVVKPERPADLAGKR